MNDPEVEAIFAEMVGDLGDIIVDDRAAFSYEALSNVELSLLYNQTRDKLYELGELLRPHSPLGQDLGAVYHGCQLELRKRRVR